MEDTKDVQSIIAASDLSDRSRPAVRRAAKLAAENDATLTVLHVVDDSMPKGLSDQLVAGAEALLSQQLSADAADLNLTADIEVVVGDAVEKVNQVVLGSKADLLVVGSHRRRTFFDQIRETTMEHLVRASRVPVLLATGQVEGDYARVLGGVDLSKVCALALHKIRMIAPRADLTLFHAHEVSFRTEAGQDYDDWKTMYPVPGGLPDPIFVEGSAVDAVREIMAENSYDLLAIGAHTRSNAGRYILGGFSSSLIRNPPCDLLVAK